MKTIRTISLSLITSLVIWSVGILLIFSSLTVATAGPFFKIDPNWQPKKPDCNCRANSEKFLVGDITCIETANGLKRAQCQMEQNNTSWKILGNSCEIAMNDWEKNPHRLSFIQPDQVTSCTL